MFPDPNYTVWKMGFDVFQFLVTMAVGIYAWASKRAAAQKKNLDAIEKRVGELEKDQVGKEDLDKIYNRINEVAVEVGQLSGEMKGISVPLNIIQDHLLNKGG